MPDFHYVYILVSEKYPDKHYTGLMIEQILRTPITDIVNDAPIVF